MSLSNEAFLDLLERNADLGHAKQNASFLRQVDLALSCPGAPLPQAAGRGASSMADLVSLWRFVDNDKVPVHRLRRARAHAVLDALPEHGDVLVVHDMSPLDFSSHNSKSDRRPIGNHRGMGYEYVCCAVVPRWPRNSPTRRGSAAWTHFVTVHGAKYE